VDAGGISAVTVAGDHTGHPSLVPGPVVNRKSHIIGNSQFAIRNDSQFTIHNQCCPN
jgi:hypothetical protein